MVMWDYPIWSIVGMLDPAFVASCTEEHAVYCVGHQQLQGVHIVNVTEGEDVKTGMCGVRVHYKVQPDDRITRSCFTPHPEKWGRGVHMIRTLEDSKLAALQAAK
jgi:hypothetical protein